MRRRRTLVAACCLSLLAACSSDDGAAPASEQIVPAAPAAGPPVVQLSVTPVEDTSGIDGVLAWDTTVDARGTAAPGALQHDHVDAPVTYAVTPPVGGPHNPVWMNAGVYTDPVPAERAVHDLEHGAVWITYRPSVSPVQVAALTAFVGRQSTVPEPSLGVSGQANRYLVLSPWGSEDLPSPIVLSSWGHQLRVDSTDDPRLQRFVDTFRNSQKYTPEYGSPVDGVPVDTGGTPAQDGGVQPNPTGSISP